MRPGLHLDLDAQSGLAALPELCQRAVYGAIDPNEDLPSVSRHTVKGLKRTRTFPTGTPHKSRRTNDTLAQLLTHGAFGILGISDKSLRRPRNRSNG